MVKGVTKRVVVVRCPDAKYFDQAIFMVRDDTMHQEGRSPEQVLEEACRVADSYIRQNVEPGRRYVKWIVCSVAVLAVLAGMALWYLL